MKDTSQIWSATARMPTFWPAKTWLRLILRLPMQMRPQAVTMTVRSWQGYSSSGKPWQGRASRAMADHFGEPRRLRIGPPVTHVEFFGRTARVD